MLYAASPSSSARVRQVQVDRVHGRSLPDPAISAAVHIPQAPPAPVFHRVREWVDWVRRLQVFPPSPRDAPEVLAAVPANAIRQVLKKAR